MDLHALVGTLHLWGPTPKVPYPPDRFWGISLLPLVASFLVYIISVGIQYQLGIILSALLGEPTLSAGLTLADLSFAASIESSCFLAGAFLGGYAFLYWGARMTLIVGSVGIVAGTFLASSATSLWQVQMCMVVLGLGCALAAHAVVCSTSVWFSTKRSAATGLVVSGSGMGALLLGPTLQNQVDIGGFRRAMRYFGVLAGVILPLATLFLIPISIDEGGGHPKPHPLPTPSKSTEAGVGGVGLEVEGGGNTVALPGGVEEEWEGGKVPPTTNTPPPHPPTTTTSSTTATTVNVTAAATEGPISSTGEASATPTPPPTPSPPPSRMWAILGYPPIQLLYAFVVIYGGVWFSVITHFNLSTREAGTSADNAALIVGAQGLSNFCGRVVMGFATDFLARWGVNKIHVMSFSVAVFGVATCLLAIPSFLSSFAYQLVFYGVCGFFGGSITALYAPVCSDLVGVTLMPLAMGFFGLVQTPSVLFSPPLVGLIRTAAGNYQGIWGGLGSLILLSVLLLLTIQRKSEITPFAFQALQ